MKISHSIFFVLLAFLSQCECILEGEPLQAEKLEKLKYLVSIVIDNRDEAKTFTCGGGILNDRMILTAAHCFARWRKSDIDNHNWIKVIGHTMTSDPNSISQASIIRYVEKIYVPEEYFKKIVDGHDVGGFADIAILRLRKSLRTLFNFRKLSKLTLPEALPSGSLPVITDPSTPPPSWNDLPYLNQEAVVAGYGAHKSTWISATERWIYAYDNALRAMDVRVCPKSNADRDPNTDRRFIMGQPYGNQKAEGICEGDSGSPLVMKRKSLGVVKDDVVIGVAAGNSDSCNDTEIPGKYTRVTTYLADFINPVLDNPELEQYDGIKVKPVGQDTC